MDNHTVTLWDIINIVIFLHLLCGDLFFLCYAASFLLFFSFALIPFLS